VKPLALHAIRLYQRFLSPYKRFCCAYAAVTGHASCSVLGYRAIRRFGVWRGLGVLDIRLHKCGVACRRHRPLREVARHGPLARQSGSLHCDLPCDLCSPCDLLDCASEWRRRKRRDDAYVVIPPRTSRPNRR
jgi:putative component of membrane protein insertase Oxa1/YidC/SpoIIIJ protein YidD